MQLCLGIFVDAGRIHLLISLTAYQCDFTCRMVRRKLRYCFTSCSFSNSTFSHKDAATIIELHKSKHSLAFLPYKQYEYVFVAHCMLCFAGRQKDKQACIHPDTRRRETNHTATISCVVTCFVSIVKFMNLIKERRNSFGVQLRHYTSEEATS